MNEQYEITEAMIRAAMATGKAAGVFQANVRHADVRRILSAGLAEFAEVPRGAKYDLVVATGITRKRARIIGLGEQRCYFRVECEDAQILTVHGNDIYPGGHDRKQQTNIQRQGARQ